MLKKRKNWIGKELKKNNLKLIYFYYLTLSMYKITAKLTPYGNDLEFNDFSELIGSDNYNDIKMLKIEGNPDDYYLKKEPLENKKRKTRTIYENKWVQYRDGKPGRYELVPVEIEIDSDDEELKDIPQIPKMRELLPDYFTYPNSLVKFILHGTNIIKLPDMSHLKKLKKVLCLFNRLESCPILPKTVEILDLSGNPVKQLPKILSNIRELSCNSCELEQMVTILPQSLKILKCSNNKMKYINYLPESLEWFDCNTNELMELPRIPHSLLYLNCSHNNIKGLPSSIFFSKLCNFILYSNGQYQFHHAKVNYNEEKLIINDNPVCEIISIHCDGRMDDYIFRKKAVDIIGNAFLEAKYNPKYKYCRERLENEFDDLYE